MTRYIVIVALFSLVFGQWLDLAHMDTVPIDGTGADCHACEIQHAYLHHNHYHDDQTAPHTHMGCHVLHHVAEGAAPAALIPPPHVAVLPLPDSRSSSGRALAPPVPPPLA